MNDFDLLHAYIERGAEDAFTELVNRHINLVYSAAIRQARDPHAAGEITQSVFIVLARKATTIRPGTILAGWLLRTTRYTAANARRREQHRHETEQKAMEQISPTETEIAWKELSPLLDEAMVALGPQDRDAVALRFFEQKSFKEIGAALSLSEDSARKRVSRAIDRLRSILTKRSCTLSAAVLTASISANAAKAAPAGLTATVASAALLKGAVAAGSVPLLVQSTLATLSWLRWRAIGISVVALVLALGLGIVSASRLGADKLQQPNRNRTIAPALAEKSTPNAAVPSRTSPLEAGPQTGGKSILLRILDADAQTPIDKARLTLFWIIDSPDRLTNTFVTDVKGECRLPIDPALSGNWDWRVEVFKDGYVPKFVNWSSWQGDSLDSFPAEYTAKLSRGVDIGGVVVNESGEPIPGVRVVFSVSGPAPGASHDRERLTMMGHYHTEVTDIEGKWHCNHVPQQFGMITYECMHPSYLTSQFGSAALGTSTNLGFTYVAAAELQNGTAKTILRPGTLVAGVVMDETGRPIPHAKVTEDRYWSEPSASEQTGNGGRFQFANTSKKDLVLTVQANDFAPMDVIVHPGDQSDALRLTLSKGNRLRARIVNDFGEPIANAKIRAGNTESGPKFEWTALTDADGKFEWLNAPAEETYAISASGFQSQSELKLSADGSEHEITLRRNAQPSPAFHIAGTVVDSETRQPIESFKVLTTITEGVRTPEGLQTHSIGSPELQVIGSAGKFSFNANKSALNCVVEIQSSGFSPARTDVEGPLDKDVQLSFELKHATPLTGNVRMADGTPVCGALVVLSSEASRQQGAFPTLMERVYMKVPGSFDLTRTQIPHATTDVEGRFSFEPKFTMKKILVAHTSGFAEVPVEQLATNPAVTLRPWGRVVGSLQIGNTPGTNETLYLRNWGWSYLFSYSLEINLEAKTDSEGRFTVEGVPPGDWQISHEVKLRRASEERKPFKVKFGSGYSMVIPRTSGPSLVTILHVEPGATTEIKLGGTGCQVVGKLRAANIAQPIDWTRDVQRLTSNPGVSAVGPAPKRQDFNTEKEYFAAQQQWYGRLREFWLSEAGIRAKSATHEYTAIFEADGTFRINDVLPGTYQFEIHVSDPNDPRGLPFGKSIATLTKEITVDAGNEKPSEPLDLGVIELTANEK